MSISPNLSPAPPELHPTPGGGSGSTPSSAANFRGVSELDIESIDVNNRGAVEALHLALSRAHDNPKLQNLEGLDVNKALALFKDTANSQKLGDIKNCFHPQEKYKLFVINGLPTLGVLTDSKAEYKVMLTNQETQVILGMGNPSNFKVGDSEYFEIPSYAKVEIKFDLHSLEAPTITFKRDTKEDEQKKEKSFKLQFVGHGQDGFFKLIPSDGGNPDPYGEVKTFLDVADGSKMQQEARSQQHHQQSSEMPTPDFLSQGDPSKKLPSNETPSNKTDPPREMSSENDERFEFSEDETSREDETKRKDETPGAHQLEGGSESKDLPKGQNNPPIKKSKETSGGGSDIRKSVKIPLLKKGNE
ncbi:MAG: hypothetical protein LBI69_02070 [Puniceicoccales bacterium]|jgi:hypothetical protein|nr:hypothetical protein [Puniceicoccales bacterium]